MKEYSIFEETRIVKKNEQYVAETNIAKIIFKRGFLKRLVDNLNKQPRIRIYVKKEDMKKVVIEINGE